MSVHLDLEGGLVKIARRLARDFVDEVEWSAEINVSAGGVIVDVAASSGEVQYVRNQSSETMIRHPKGAARSIGDDLGEVSCRDNVIREIRELAFKMRHQCAPDLEKNDYQMGASHALSDMIEELDEMLEGEDRGE